MDYTTQGDPNQVTPPVYMWCHTGHPVIWVVPAQGSAAVFSHFHDNVLWTRHFRSVSSSFWMLCHRARLWAGAYFLQT